MAHGRLGDAEPLRDRRVRCPFEVARNEGLAQRIRKRGDRLIDERHDLVGLRAGRRRATHLADSRLSRSTTSIAPHPVARAADGECVEKGRERAVHPHPPRTAAEELDEALLRDVLGVGGVPEDATTSAEDETRVTRDELGDRFGITPALPAFPEDGIDHDTRRSR